MKHLKSTSTSLRHLFERSITVRTIAEPLTSFDATTPALGVLAFMNERDFDVVGVRTDGLVTGYAHRDELSGATLADHARDIPDASLTSAGAPLLDVFEALRENHHLFVLTLGAPGGIVTRGDLQKAPVRMWLFGLISLIEMNLTRIIRQNYPEDTWQMSLKPQRVDGARKIQLLREGRNQAIDLIECLQIVDKREILLQNDQIRTALGYPDPEEFRGTMTELENLRNALAHGNYILNGQGSQLADMAAAAEALLTRAESL